MNWMISSPVSKSQRTKARGWVSQSRAPLFSPNILDPSKAPLYCITFSDRPNIVKGLPDEVTDRLPESSPPPQEQPADQESASDDRQPTSSQPTSNPRTELYQLIPQLVRAGKLSAEGANQLANYAKEEGYAAALKAARDLANRDAAPQPAKQAQSQPKSQPEQKPKAQPTAAELLYPKNELDDFFPRE